MKKILIIDDDVVIRDSMSLYLSDKGYDVVIAENGIQGISKVKEQSFDLVFVDFRMPGLSGIEFLEMTKKILPKLPVVIFSGTHDINLVIDAMRKGAWDFLTKPIYNMEILDITINKIFEKVELIRIDEEYKISLEREIGERTKDLEDANKLLKETMVSIEKNNVDLKHAREEADRANQFKSTFLLNLSHEVRTPLYGLISYLDLLGDEKTNEEDQVQYVKYAQKSCDRMMQLINDLIDVSKIEAGVIEIQNQRVIVSELFNEIYANFKSFSEEKNISLVLNEGIEDFAECILIDYRKLKQVISKLVHNGIKFTDKGSVEINCEEKGEKFLITITDTGIGISEEECDKIFNYFSQGVENIGPYEGIGVGLSISKTFVEAMGGKIWIETSKERAKTNFYVELPLVKIELDEAKEKVVKTNFESDKKVLVTDDDESILFFVSKLFEKNNVKYITATNGQEAVSIIREFDDIALVIMDIKMPVMNGEEATKIIKEIKPELPVIAHTAFGPELNLEKTLSCGFDSLMSKPIDRKKFMNAIMRYFF
jgi:signal transduction histidine kinase